MQMWMNMEMLLNLGIVVACTWTRMVKIDREINILCAICFLRGKASEALENRAQARLWYKAAIKVDPLCYEALACLVENHMLTCDEEASLLSSLLFGAEDGWLSSFYSCFVKKDKGVLPSEKLGFNIQIPSSLKKQLVDDCEFITHLDKLVQLSRSPSVNEILSKYNDYRLKNDGIIADSVSEILSGLQCYFDKALSAMLLYKNEREQYQEAITDGVSPSVYGAEHLLRFGMLVFFGLQFQVVYFNY
ncbi:PREDICTED: uncharacterized protein LOC109169573 [Ipomoea nil]|uniref:uncharacterized protein LOC109169573 n=1 Tax=Ipomoea nil TaxID=35883 RepID=UPI00090198C0|nr:PREDICTED: uncharacterized protein LOC109169573 [Ipomoea nil]